MQSLAAANNAEWCDAVCRSHGVDTRFDDDAWTARSRTPPFYPDAVTLTPDPSIPELLGRIEASAGCSIKDSFASLDLQPHGYRVLFEAEWIARPPTAASPPEPAEADWEVLNDPEAFTAWERAWRGDGPADVLRAELLDDAAVTLLAARGGDRVVAGAVLNRSAEVVGISNLFGRRDGCIAFAAALVPGSTLVGYDTGDALETARANGFVTVGPLRVWVHD
jgi:hypothetical protein